MSRAANLARRAARAGALPGNWGSGTGLPNMVATIDPRSCGSSTSLTANSGKGGRVIVPCDGTLHDIAIGVVTQSGNISVAIYDTGDTTPAVYTRLWTSGAVACPAGGLQIVADPALAVTAGQQLVFFLTADNGTATFWRNNVAAANDLPAGYLKTTGGVSPRLFVGATTVHPAPTTIADASLTSSQVVMLIMARIA